jgi:hypothetical protein
MPVRLLLNLYSTDLAIAAGNADCRKFAVIEMDIQ